MNKPINSQPTAEVPKGPFNFHASFSITKHGGWQAFNSLQSLSCNFCTEASKFSEFVFSLIVSKSVELHSKSVSFKMLMVQSVPPLSCFVCLFGICGMTVNSHFIHCLSIVTVPPTVHPSCAGSYINSNSNSC